jgi:GH24 family phage-related lysozyme (muramidase)
MAIKNLIVITLISAVAITGLYFLNKNNNDSENTIIDFLKLNSQGCSCDSLENMVAWAEGRKNCVYKDSLGIPTIGIGFNMNRGNAKSLFSSCNIGEFDKYYTGAKCLVDSQVSCLFNLDIKTSIQGANNCVPFLNQLPKCVQNVLIDMSFNMGPASLCSWPNFLSQLKAGKKSEAAQNMKSSKWCSQVGRRCTRNADLVAGC